MVKRGDIIKYYNKLGLVVEAPCILTSISVGPVLANVTFRNEIKFVKDKFLDGFIYELVKGARGTRVVSTCNG